MKTLLILTLALTCIFLECEYFFTTNNMLMFEFLISALPSVALSLQPNTNRVKGKFIPYVLSRALPGAFTMAVGILSIYVLHRTPLSEAFALNASYPARIIRPFTRRL
jgi:cation-transporting ATPase E